MLTAIAQSGVLISQRLVIWRWDNCNWVIRMQKNSTLDEYAMGNLNVLLFESGYLEVISLINKQ
jgi:hypothetical protein